jgi:hypothetical protein
VALQTACKELTYHKEWKLLVGASFFHPNPFFPAEYGRLININNVVYQIALGFELNE